MRNRSIIIELTALLDVIIIMMFVILVQSGNQVETAQASAAELAAKQEALLEEYALLTEEAEELRTENDRLGRWVDGRATADENSHVITLSVRNTPERRFIVVESEGVENARIPLSWDNGQYAANALYAELTSSIQKSSRQVVFLVFHYDRAAIYQTDYMLVHNAIQQQKNNPHVYSAEYDIGAKEAS